MWIKRLIEEIKECLNRLFIVNRVLSLAEIEWMYKNTKPQHQEWWFVENGKLVYYWPNWEKY